MKIALTVLLGAVVAAQSPAPPPAATYKTEAELTAALKNATPDMLSSPVSIEGHHRINIVRRTKGAGAVAHEGAAELHHIIEGSGTLVTGGTIVRPAGGPGVATIQGGVSRHVTKGDVIVVPAGMPHWYKDLDGPITYLEVRWDEK
jgi:mannose-6-phosphate isomerase-like protein (cupin superfamily)